MLPDNQARAGGKVIGLPPELRDQIESIEDDVSVEDRFPNVKWSGQPAFRLAQRKCFLMSEWYERQAEFAMAIMRDDKQARAKHAVEYAAFRGPASNATTRPRSQFAGESNWDGIESTAPPSVRARM